MDKIEAETIQKQLDMWEAATEAQRRHVEGQGIASSARLEELRQEAEFATSTASAFHCGCDYCESTALAHFSKPVRSHKAAVRRNVCYGSFLLFLTYLSKRVGVALTGFSASPDSIPLKAIAS